MNIRPYSLRSLLTVTCGLLLATSFSPAARAETTNCTPITSLPAVISAQGVYCLTGPLGTAAWNGNAITINANNVTIDLNGFKLGGLAAGTNTYTKGIYANNRANITIRNGTVRGFSYGIHMDGSSSLGHLIEDVRLDQNRNYGVYVRGTGHTIRRNQVLATGGSTVITTIAVGLLAWGDNMRIMNNDVSDTYDATQSYGIQLYLGANGVIKHNAVSGVTNTGTALYIAGINLKQATGLVIGNEVMDTGETCILFNGASTGIYRDNTVSGCSVNYSGGGGVDGGGNFPLP